MEHLNSLDCDIGFRIIKTDCEDISLTKDEINTLHKHLKQTVEDIFFFNGRSLDDITIEELMQWLAEHSPQQ